MPFLTFVAGPRAPLAPSCPLGTPAGALYQVSGASGTDVWLSGVDFTGGFACVNLHGSLAGWADVGAPPGADDWAGSGVGRTDSDLWHLATGAGTTSQVYHWDGSAWTLSTAVGLPVGDVGGITDVTPPGVVSASEVYVAVTGGPDQVINLYTWDGSAWTPIDFTTSFANPDVQSIAALGGESWGFGRQKKAGGSRNGNAYILYMGAGSGIDYYQGNGTPSGVVHGGWAGATDDVWGAGWLTDNSADLGFQPSLWHYDGAAWTVVTPPWPYSSGSGGQGELFSVHGVAADDLWAVGYWRTPDGVTQRTLIYHWDGAAWTRVVPVPDFKTSGGDDPILYSVYAVAADDAWAVGEACGQQLLMHWDGLTWTAQPLSY